MTRIGITVKKTFISAIKLAFNRQLALGSTGLDE